MCNFINFIDKISELWNEELLGELIDVKVDSLTPRHATEEQICSDISIKLLLANIATALSTCDLLGTATETNLKSVKSRMDTSASDVYSHIIKKINDKIYIASSEGKDEHGDSVDDPLKRNESASDSGKYGIAVDVIDGTTLAAKGINGSYSLSAAAFGLMSFPDIQAYAIGAPAEVIDRVNFSNPIEVEAEALVQNLSVFYNKPISELIITTHSFDTGKHHTELISKLKNMGVKVIIPDPVIVETSYVLGMATKTVNAPDAIIGVFGLPEAVINTLLTAIVNSGFEIRFKIASNTMLKNRDELHLNNTFAFSQKELSEIEKLNLDINAVYCADKITDDLRNSCFAATALTNDPILKLNGISRENEICKLETIFSLYDDIIYKITTTHLLRNYINYSAVFPQEINDLSVVLPVKDKKAVHYLQTFIDALKQSSCASSLSFTAAEDLHVTLYELCTHYGKTPNNIDMQIAINEAVDFFNNFPDSVSVKIKQPAIMRDSIIMEIDVKEDYISNDALLKSDFFNVKSVPGILHITIARFSKYLNKRKYEELLRIINDYPLTSGYEVSGKPMLVNITTTPYVVTEDWIN